MDFISATRAGRGSEHYGWSTAKSPWAILAPQARSATRSTGCWRHCSISISNATLTTSKRAWRRSVPATRFQKRLPLSDPELQACLSTLSRQAASRARRRGSRPDWHGRATIDRMFRVLPLDCPRGAWAKSLYARDVQLNREVTLRTGSRTTCRRRTARRPGTIHPRQPKSPVRSNIREWGPCALRFGPRRPAVLRDAIHPRR